MRPSPLDPYPIIVTCTPRLSPLDAYAYGLLDRVVFCVQHFGGLGCA
jgi:hypothetical protein